MAAPGSVRNTSRLDCGCLRAEFEHCGGRYWGFGEYSSGCGCSFIGIGHTVGSIVSCSRKEIVVHNRVGSGLGNGKKRINVDLFVVVQHSSHLFCLDQGWMYNELQNPKHSIADSFSEKQISAIAAASVAICGAVGAFTFLHWIYHCILTKSISHRAGEAGEQKSLTGVSKMKSH